MINHIVMWRFKDTARGKTKTENMAEFAAMLENLVGIIPQIRHLEVGTNVIDSDTASDVVLNSRFDSLEDLDLYNTHPEHQKVIALAKEVVAERRAVDYETP
ncbi:MAG: Dabb family protein [Desulfobacterales bacterium]|nr:Dabb family protein [Desulfobacterales bacterium]